MVSLSQLICWKFGDSFLDKSRNDRPENYTLKIAVNSSKLKLLCCSIEQLPTIWIQAGEGELPEILILYESAEFHETRSFGKPQRPTQTFNFQGGLGSIWTYQNQHHQKLDLHICWSSYYYNTSLQESSLHRFDIRRSVERKTRVGWGWGSYQALVLKHGITTESEIRIGGPTSR